MYTGAAISRQRPIQTCLVDTKDAKIRGAAEHLIDGSKKKHLSVELWILESACYWKTQ